jgi:hypothetical protein
MRPRTFLRIAAVITLLYCAGHSAGIPWTPVKGIKENEVIEAMKTNTFEASGVIRSYWDYYFGFGLLITAFLLFKSIVLWQLSSTPDSEYVRLRSIIYTFVASFVINAALSWKYFFAVPAIMAGTVAILLIVTLFTMRKLNTEG